MCFDRLSDQKHGDHDRHFPSILENNDKYAIEFMFNRNIL